MSSSNYISEYTCTCQWTPRKASIKVAAEIATSGYYVTDTLQSISSSQLESLLLLIPVDFDTVACDPQIVVSDLSCVRSCSMSVTINRTHRVTDITDLLLEVGHVDFLLLPRLLRLLETKELVEDVLMRHDTSIAPLCGSSLTARLPLHLFLDLCCTHISGLLCTLCDLVIAPYLSSAAAALLKCRQLCLKVVSILCELVVWKREQRLECVRCWSRCCCTGALADAFCWSRCRC